MTTLTGQDAILRLRQNEARFDEFINQSSGYYIASDGRRVPTLAQWLDNITSNNPIMVPVLPGTIHAMADDGDWRPGQWTDKHSPTVREIRECYEIDGEIGIRFKEPHGFVEGQTVFVRIEGQCTRSDRAHPANNWTGGQLRDPTTGALSNASNAYAWGGDPWSNIQYIDEYRICLRGSQWKMDPSDDDPVFCAGYAYRELIGGAGQALADACDWLQGRKGTITVGIGWYAWLGSDPTVVIPSNVRIQCAGMFQTNFVACDFYNRQLMAFTGSEWSISDATFWGNRQFYGSGIHVLRLGIDGGDNPLINCSMHRIRTIGSSGYGMNMGKGSNKISLILNQVYILRPNNDFIDVKNKGKGNKHNWMLAFEGDSPGMGTVGTNRGMHKDTLNTNPLYTEVGSTRLSIAIKRKAYVNDAIWISESTVNGITVEGWYRIVQIANYNVWIETGQEANATGAGGGTGIQTQHARREKGSTGCDFRGPGWSVLGFKAHGDLDQQIGIRTRGGSINNPNGPGGHLTILSAIEITDETRHPTSTAQLMILQSDSVVVEGAVLKGIGGDKGSSFGLWVGIESTRAQGRNIIIEDVVLGVLYSGDRSNFDVSTHGCGRGAVCQGGPIATGGSLSSTVPFEVTVAGANPTVVVTHEVVHGLSGGESISYAKGKVDPAINVNMNDQTFTVGSILSPTSYEVTVTGAEALTTGVFGGEEAEFVLASGTRNASDNELKIRAFNCFGRPVEIEADADRTKIFNSHAADNGTPGPQDLSTSTIWGPGNSGEFPNCDEVIIIPDNADEYNLTLGSIGRWHTYSGTGTKIVNLVTPANKAALGGTVKFLKRGSTGALSLKTPAGVIKSGAETTTGGGAATSSGESACCFVTCLASDRWFLDKQGTTWNLT